MGSLEKERSDMMTTIGKGIWVRLYHVNLKKGRCKFCKFDMEKRIEIDDIIIQVPSLLRLTGT